MSEAEPIITKTGKILTEADLEALADEAEEGYDTTDMISVHIDREGSGVTYSIVQNGIVLGFWPAHMEPFPQDWPDEWKELVNRVRARHEDV